jgi:hypothetical protein
VSFTGARLRNPEGLALNGSRLEVGGALFCGHQIGDRGGFSAQGRTWLVDARIGAFLSLEGASVSVPDADGTSLLAERMTVGRDIVMTDGFTAAGTVDLTDVSARALHCGDASLTGGPRALVGTRLSLSHDLVCGAGFRARGDVVFRSARVGGDVSFEGGRFEPAGDAPGTLDLRDLSGAGAVVLTPRSLPGAVDLMHARVRVLADNEASWPEQLNLVNFSYDHLHEDPPVPVDDRLRWLARGLDRYTSQPYEQLATAYRRAGRNEDAGRVAIAKQRERHRGGGRPMRLWGLVLDALVGYGFRTWQAGLWFVGFLVAGWAVFAASYPAHLSADPGNNPRLAFQPLVYSLDTLLPVVDLGQQDHWTPDGPAQWWAWVSVLAGWVLTTAIVAALAGVMKKD